MNEAIPPQCPECGSTNLQLSRVAPAEHDHGDEWVTHATCGACEEYVEWFN
ncbi:hypothetical protein [Natronococcus sp.]|uniref:hypothetical protein n=1 Tax=Natronococcus sp. TaxID=35747 RepID=UPI003A4DB7F3